MVQVRQVLGDCERCGLCRERGQLVFGAGDSRSRLMVVGEAPGFHEDREGVPFVGRAGQMLERMLSNVLGLGREQVFITNVVKCRPPENRNPTPDEIGRCLPFLRAQMRVVAPEVVLVLGSVATRALFGPEAGVTRVRGPWREVSWAGGSAQAMATFHPAYLLRRPEDKRLTFQDLKEVKRMLMRPEK